MSRRGGYPCLTRYEEKCCELAGAFGSLVLFVARAMVVLGLLWLAGVGRG